MMTFTKMHGLGNDFIVIDATHHPFTASPQQIALWGDRHTGIGFDQCLVVEKSHKPEIDFFYRIFNANGQEVGQCGNGARCLARFVYAKGLIHKPNIRVQTATTQLELYLHEDHSVSVTFPPPQLEPKCIPLLIGEQSREYRVTLGTQSYFFHAIHVGNPHAVLVGENWTDADIATLGPQLSTHPLFPEQTNVGFLTILNAQHIQLRVYERGCGETRACGSGAVAAAALGHLYHHMDSTIEVSLPGGNLRIDWPDQQGSIFMRGPAEFVYDGQIIGD